MTENIDLPIQAASGQGGKVLQDRRVRFDLVTGLIDFPEVDRGFAIAVRVIVVAFLNA